MVVSKNGSMDWDMVESTGETPALTLSVLPKHHTIGENSNVSTTQSCITVKARELADEMKRAPVDIMVGLDVSGSMAGDKLALCKASLDLLLRQLNSNDRFGLVSFSDDATLEIPLAKLSDAHKQLSFNKIKSLQTRGCTNISAAVSTAVPMLQMVETPSEVRTVFLLTDGMANMGVSNRPELVELTKNWLQGSLASSKEGSPITMHCFGYGSTHDSGLLREMAQCSEGGTYYFVETDSSVATAIGDALGGVLSVVAQGATLHISVPQIAKELGVEIVRVYHDKAIKNEDGSYIVSIGDFYAEETRDVLFEVKLSAGKANAAPMLHAEVSLTFSDTLLKIPSRQGPVALSIARPEGIEVSAVDPHVAMQLLRVTTTKKIAEANQAASVGHFDLARATVNRAIDDIRAEGAVQSDPLVQQLIEDLNNAKIGLQSREHYESFGTHQMTNAYYSHSTQRCVDSTPRSSNTYRGSLKAATALRFAGTKKHQGK